MGCFEPHFGGISSSGASASTAVGWLCWRNSAAPTAWKASDPVPVTVGKPAAK